VARTATVTVVFTDLVGSTELASRLGHDAYETLRHMHFSALRTAAAGHNGVEIKTTGELIAAGRRGRAARYGARARAVGAAASEGRSFGLRELQR
jgi:class 3 adenylate cyclase